VGPTTALECDRRDGAHVDGDRWLVEVGPRDELSITNRVPRLTPCVRLPTGLVGRIVDEPCPCGRAGPRLVVG
jgi:phenylacetate-CoA ligase